jgi:hypothetical protein
MGKIVTPGGEEALKTITLTVDGEAREYEVESLSKEAVNRLNVLNFHSNSIMPLLTEVVRLIQLGNQVDQSQLTQHLPEKYTVVQQAEDAVESDTKNTNEDDSSKEGK